jgi:hypothetical protein
VLSCGLLLASCKPYDESLLPPQGGAAGNGGGGGGMDASTQDASGDGGLRDGDTDACASGARELCNRIDDDCDGEIDNGAEVVCEETILHAETDCVAYANTKRCVLLRCREGYDNCDGNPANGCEPFCDCNLCEDAGGEDAGE